MQWLKINNEHLETYLKQYYNIYLTARLKYNGMQCKLCTALSKTTGNIIFSLTVLNTLLTFQPLNFRKSYILETVQQSKVFSNLVS